MGEDDIEPATLDVMDTIFPVFTPSLLIKKVNMKYNLMDMDDILIDLDGFACRQLPKETELEAALDSWWLLPKCEAYGLSKAGLLRALRELHTSSVFEIAEVGHQFLTSGEAIEALKQYASERKIEDVALVAMEGEVKHELSLKEKIAELMALGMALLYYVSSLGGHPRSETAAFAIGHKRRELVAFWCKDPSKNYFYYSNLVSKNVFELAKSTVGNSIHILPEVCNHLTPSEFLGSLTRAGGTKEVSLSSPCDYLDAVFTALTMGRLDLVASIHDSLGETFGKERVEPSDADRDTAKSLLNKVGAIIGTQSIDVSINVIEQLFGKLHIMFDPTMLQQLVSLPSPLQKEVAHIIYAEIYNEFGKGAPEQFNEAINQAIDRMVESYTWEGVDKHGALFPELPSEQISGLKRYAENIFAEARLSESQKKVLKLELVLLWLKEKWTEKEKTKYLGMKEGSYQQHLYQARIKTNSVRHKSREHKEYERLLKAIFKEDPLTST